MSFYPQVSVVLGPHQSSSLQWIEITEENTTGLNEENLLWAVQLLGYIFNTAPASKPQETLQNGGQEDCMSQRTRKTAGWVCLLEMSEKPPMIPTQDPDKGTLTGPHL